MYKNMIIVENWATNKLRKSFHNTFYNTKWTYLVIGDEIFTHFRYIFCINKATFTLDNNKFVKFTQKRKTQLILLAVHDIGTNVGHARHQFRRPTQPSANENSTSF